MSRLAVLADPGTAVAFLGGIAVKVAILVGFLGLVDLLLGSRQAAWRSLLWKVGMAGMLLLPLLAVALPPTPRVSLPGAAYRWFALLQPLPAAPLPGPSVRSPSSGQVLRTSSSTGAGEPSLRQAMPPSAESPARLRRERQVENPVAGDEAMFSPEIESAGWADRWLWRSQWPLLVLAGYGVGVLTGLGVLLLGMRVSDRMRRSLVPLTDPSWQTRLQGLRDRLSLQRPICLGSSERVRVPVQVGVLRPTVLLPSHLLEQGAPEATAAAIIHELAHVARLDYAFNLLAGLTLALHWYNPLVWWAARRLRDAAEQACDDWSVRLTGRPSAYAEILVEVAMRLSGGRRPGLSVPMAHQPRVVERVERIVSLDGRASPVVGRLGAWAVSLGLAGCIGLLAACAVQRPPRMTEPTLLQVPLDGRVRAEMDSLLAAIDREHTQQRAIMTEELEAARQAGAPREGLIGLETSLVLDEQRHEERRHLAAETFASDRDWQRIPWDERTGWAWRYGNMAGLAAWERLPAAGLYYCQQAVAANPYAWCRGSLIGQDTPYGAKWTRLLPELAVKDRIPSAQAVEWIEADLQAIGRLRYMKEALIGPDHISEGSPWIPDPTRQESIDAREFAKRQQALLIEGSWVAYRWLPEPKRRVRLQALLREHLVTYYPPKEMERARLEAGWEFNVHYFPCLKRLLGLAASPTEARVDLTPLLAVDLARVPSFLAAPLSEILISVEIRMPGAIPADQIETLFKTHRRAVLQQATEETEDLERADHDLLQGEYAAVHEKDPAEVRQRLASVEQALGSTPPPAATLDPVNGLQDWSRSTYLWTRTRILAGDLARLEGDEAAAATAYHAALDLVRPLVVDWDIARELAANEPVTELRERLAARLVLR